MTGAADSLGSFAGATGVGALCILGVFLFLDGRAPELFPTIEEYSKTATWGVVAAIPVLAIAYVIGLMLITASCFAVRGAFGPSLRDEAADVARVSLVAVKESVLAQEYSQLKQERDVLGGAALSLIVLAIGAISDSKNLPHMRSIVIAAALSTFIAAAALFFSAGLKNGQAHTLASVVQEVPRQKP